MSLRFIIAILILMLACGLQFFLLSGGIVVNVLLATLIVFAFFFDFWELVVFILFGILVINWQPAISIEIVLFVLLPIAAFVAHKFFAWRQWAGVPIAIVISFFIFYFAAEPSALLSFGNWGAFIADLFGSLIAGELVLVALSHTKRR